MKSALLFLSILITLSSCRKYVEEKQEEAAISLATNGRWKVSSFMKGMNNKTTLFSDYVFQFLSNETVEAIRNNRLEKVGTWKVSITAQTITSSFGNVPEPLSLLNGTFKINSTTTTSVDASQTVNGELWTLHLEKL